MRVCHFKQVQGRGREDGSECEGDCCQPDYMSSIPIDRRRELTHTSYPQLLYICCGVCVNIHVHTHIFKSSKKKLTG